jgi:hypothetical protein
MQKTLIAIAFALTLTSAFGGWVAENYVKAPQSVIAASNDTNYTNTAALQLASVTSGDVYLVSSNMTTNNGTATNASNINWNVWYRKLDAKSLTAGANSTAAFVAPVGLGYLNNYAYSFGSENVSGIYQLFVYQSPLAGGNGLRLQIGNNSDSTLTPRYVSAIPVGKTLVVFYVSANKTVNFTTVTVGSSTVGTQGTLSSTLDDNSGKTVNVYWGEALGSNQVLALWTENGALQEAVVDTGKATVTKSTPGGYDKSYTCMPYSTDKKYYGSLCLNLSSDMSSINYYVRTNSTNLVRFANYSTTTSTFNSYIPYGPFLAVMFTDSTTTQGKTLYSYEIWNLDTLTLNKNRTRYLTVDGKSAPVPFRVPAGGYYTLLKDGDAYNVTSVQVGLLLGSSSLVSVLGFIMTIVAGLFLF